MKNALAVKGRSARVGVLMQGKVIVCCVPASERLRKHRCSDEYRTELEEIVSLGDVVEFILSSTWLVAIFYHRRVVIMACESG